MTDTEIIVSVLLPVPLAGYFSYLVDSENPPHIGQWVRVSFGSRLLDGVIVNLAGEGVSHMKPLEKIYQLPHLRPHLMDFIHWMASYTMNPPGLVLKMLLPDKLLGDPLKHLDSPKLPTSPDIKALTENQKEAAHVLRTQLGTYHVTVLDGVTGSGKTEVYFDLIEAAMAQDFQTLVLLPEIALSTQWIERYTARFGERPCIWHSEITPAQKRKVWHQVIHGQARVVVGARSSLFLPFPNLKVIIVDEEHDPSYKQEDGVIYNGRDMAIVRGKLEGALVVLASATPCLETMENVHSKRYGYLSLPHRFNLNQLPSVKLIDMRGHKGRGSWISAPLREALLETFAAGEQSLLFLNRRGYAPVTLCSSCGHRFACPDCAAWLVKHKHVEHIQCHHCGYTAPVPKACPSCHEEDTLLPCGPGVERISDEVQALLPNARILIMSSDKLTNLKAVEEAVAGIQKGEVDVIVGTQLIAKGHDFKGLSCVGIIDGDLGLVGGDLRSGERTFQLLMQVAGRAGRHHTLGRVFLQTYDPTNPLMEALVLSDRDAFMAAEMEQRKAFGWPPFGRLASLILSSKDEVLLEKCVKALARKAPILESVKVLGPAPAALYKIRGKFRWRFLIKTPKSLTPQNYINTWLSQFKLPRTITCHVDIDPQSFF